MRLAEINLFGVYVAPISVMMVAAWFVTIVPSRWPLRPATTCRAPGSLRFAVYVIVLSSWILIVVVPTT